MQTYSCRVAHDSGQTADQMISQSIQLTPFRLILKVALRLAAAARQYEVVVRILVADSNCYQAGRFRSDFQKPVDKKGSSSYLAGNAASRRPLSKGPLSAVSRFCRLLSVANGAVKTKTNWAKNVLCSWQDFPCSFLWITLVLLIGLTLLGCRPCYTLPLMVVTEHSVGFHPAVLLVYGLSSEIAWNTRTKKYVAAEQKRSSSKRKEKKQRRHNRHVRCSRPAKVIETDYVEAPPPKPVLSGKKASPE